MKKTTIIFYKSGGIFYGFEEQGHTGYADAGEDILCAGISSMTMLIINAFEVGFDTRVDYNIDEVTTNITLTVKSALPKYEKDEKKQFAAEGLIKAYFYQLMDLTEEYYDFLEVREVEREI